MATINRFNKFLPRDYSMKWYAPQQYVPNFEAWDKLLAEQQQKYNTAIAITQKYPKHLEWRSDLASQYKENVDSKINDITNTFMKEGVRAGNSKLRDFTFELNQQWNPGGLAYELENEYNDYANSIKQISDYYEKNKAENSANRTYSLYKLNQEARKDYTYDSKSNLYSRASLVPDLVPYVDIADESFKVAKEIKETGTTDIIPYNKAWFEKIQTEGITPETVQKVTTELLNQPKYAQQLNVEKWLMDQQYSPEQKSQIEQTAKNSVVNTAKNALDKIDKLSKSKNANDVKTLQQSLTNLGYYTGEVDGKVGKETNKALDLYKADVNANTEKNLEKVNYDSVIRNQIIESYTKPLINTFAYEKVKKDLIFNQEWAINAKIAAQRKDTQDLISAVQSLKEPNTSDYLVTPGLASPSEGMDKLKKQSQEVYDQSKKSFDNISQFSGITDIIGYRAPNKIHEVTQARMQSGSFDQFADAMSKLGYSPEIAKNAWGFYSSPAASDLYNAYTSMQSAKESVDSIDKAKSSMLDNYFKSPEGKKELVNTKKQFGFEGSDAEFADLMSHSQKGKDIFELSWSDRRGTENFIKNYKQQAVNSLLTKMDNYYKSNPTAVPQSLRGYGITAIKGEGNDLHDVIANDMTSGYTLGYSSNGEAGVTFSHIGSKDRVPMDNVKLDNTDFRFNVDASGVTYYLTGKDSNGKPVSSVVNAPREHYGRLARMALSLKKQAKETGDTDLDKVANQLYSTVTEGAQYQYAVDDALVLNNNNTTQLSRVIDPQRSKRGDIQTFANNSNVKGIPVGSEKNVDGLIYQKFKVYNPKTNSTAYMQTVKTEDGLYLPISNNTGGLYYESSMEAESPLMDRKMLDQIPVEINQQKIKSTNLTDEESKFLLLGRLNSTRSNG